MTTRVFSHRDVIALPGEADGLLSEREMENDYLRRIGRPQNLIFTKTLGGSWDSFTLGLYRDLKHYTRRARTYLPICSRRRRWRRDSRALGGLGLTCAGFSRGTTIHWERRRFHELRLAR